MHWYISVELEDPVVFKILLILNFSDSPYKFKLDMLTVQQNMSEHSPVRLSQVPSRYK